MHDVSQIQRRVLAELPPDKRTARALLVLVESTRQAGQRSLDGIGSVAATGTPAELRMQLLEELEGLGERLVIYREALAAVKPDDPMPEAVVPLLRRVRWPDSTPAEKRHFTPDFLVPFVVDNQHELLAEFYEFQSDAFFDYLRTGLREALRDAGHAIGSGAAEVLGGLGDGLLGGSSSWGWVVGGITVAAVAGSLVYIARSPDAHRRVRG